KFASQSLIAFANIVSNTGLSWPTEELIMPRTSALAVCCSRDSRSSLSSRAFSIAMTACVAKFCAIAICLSVNGRTSFRTMEMTPINSPSRSIVRKELSARHQAQLIERVTDPLWYEAVRPKDRLCEQLVWTWLPDRLLFARQPEVAQIAAMQDTRAARLP